jgi:hypothetical protein
LFTGTAFTPSSQTAAGFLQLLLAANSDKPQAGCAERGNGEVEFLELLGSGMTNEQILADYADLEADDLRAACAYGARLSRVHRLEPLAG